MILIALYFSTRPIEHSVTEISSRAQLVVHKGICLPVPAEIPWGSASCHLSLALEGSSPIQLMFLLVKERWRLYTGHSSLQCWLKRNQLYGLTASTS